MKGSDGMELTSVCQKAIHILRQTEDGETLSPRQLYLVQQAVNQVLNKAGMEKFEELYQKVLAGDWKEWLFDIEHMTKDHSGYIYWKGVMVEHFSFSNYKLEKEAADKLARRCQILETKGVPVSVESAVLFWDERNQ